MKNKAPFSWEREDGQRRKETESLRYLAFAERIEDEEGSEWSI